MNDALTTTRWRACGHAAAAVAALLFALALLALLTAPAHADAPAPGDATPVTGEALYETRCAACHQDPLDSKAPTLEAMRLMHPRRLGFVLTQGVMQAQAAGLTGAELQALIAYVAGSGAPASIDAGAFCSDRTVALTDLDAPPSITGWGMAPGSARFVNGSNTSIDAGNVGQLRLKWAFGLPGTESARSQPVLAGNALFVASTSGDLFALDREQGCIKWHYRSPTPLRTSLALGSIDVDGADTPTLFVGDSAGGVNAVDAVSGDLRWRTHVAPFQASMLTGTPVVHGDKLVVPISSFEVGMARNPEHECCRTHGAVALLDARTGDVRWTTPMAEPATPRGKSRTGVQLWGPSGVPVWSTPTVDAKRNVVYVATGQNYSLPATEYSDAILALDLDTGAIVWHFQATANDVWNSACSWRNSGPNCPDEPGPDFDFGAGVIITQTSSGRDVLLAGQKSGTVFALDPDANGKLIWEREVGAGSALGGVHWGMTADATRVYVPIADPTFPFRQSDYNPRPGLYALSIDDGRIAWRAPAPGNCDLSEQACRFFYRLSAAPTGLPGLVFAPGLDGQLRAFSASDGALLWSFDTVGEHATVNGVPARGGSIDSAGVIAAGSMVYVQSGYGGFGQMPGNVLMAFGL